MTLIDIALDLQIVICTFLQPSDILTLRKTCKTLQLATRQRIIWVAALRRMCLENRLFLPSFPIPDMSDVELEHAAVAPEKWIELSASIANQGFSDSEVKLSPTTTRVIDNPFTIRPETAPIFTPENILILVPGGRYMVGYSTKGLGIWDLGYISSADCKLIASIVPEGGSIYAEVFVTPDDMGLVISSLSPYDSCSLYEIYPQSETPQLNRIAYLAPPNQAPDHVSDKMIWYSPFHPHGIIVRVWDYRLNASASFTAKLDLAKVAIGYMVEVLVTQTAIIILHDEEILIWAIPPLSPQTPNFDDHNPTQLSPQFRLRFPDDPTLRSRPAEWRTMSRCYFRPSQPLYLDKVYSQDSRLKRFKIIINPDLSDATLQFINTFWLTSHFFDPESTYVSMFCEDAMVCYSDIFDQCGMYTGSIPSRPTKTTLQGDVSMGRIPLLLPVDRSRLSFGRTICFCPVSCRLVRLDRHDLSKIVVYDFLPPHPQQSF